MKHFCWGARDRQRVHCKGERERGTTTNAHDVHETGGAPEGVGLGAGEEGGRERGEDGGREAVRVAGDGGVLGEEAHGEDLDEVREALEVADGGRAARPEHEHAAQHRAQHGARREAVDAGEDRPRRVDADLAVQAPRLRVPRVGRVVRGRERGVLCAARRQHAVDRGTERGRRARRRRQRGPERARGQVAEQEPPEHAAQPRRAAVRKEQPPVLEDAAVAARRRAAEEALCARARRRRALRVRGRTGGLCCRLIDDHRVERVAHRRLQQRDRVQQSACRHLLLCLLFHVSLLCLYVYVRVYAHRVNQSLSRSLTRFTC